MKLARYAAEALPLLLASSQQVRLPEGVCGVYVGCAAVRSCWVWKKDECALLSQQSRPFQRSNTTRDAICALTDIPIAWPGCQAHCKL